MSYDSIGEYISATIGSAYSAKVKTGEGLSYEEFINTGGDSVDMIYISQDGIKSHTQYEGGYNGIYEVTCTVFVRAKSDIYTKVLAIFAYYAAHPYYTDSGSKTHTIGLNFAIPSREAGRNTWELNYSELIEI